MKLFKVHLYNENELFFYNTRHFLRSIAKAMVRKNNDVV